MINAPPKNTATIRKVRAQAFGGISLRKEATAGGGESGPGAGGCWGGGGTCDKMNFLVKSAECEKSAANISTASVV
ncbi:hypothetical protein GCM10009720_25870 [Yaniella flava]|uniref:Uncharacterized protein n=1 Tax=Yaniella flava TaxID=287930 RepID=A0ABP5GEQ5_9MICC